MEDHPSGVHGYSGRQSAEVVGISYRQLDYWARTDLIRPSLTDASGSGSRRRYSYRDLLELKIIKRLLDAGISLPAIRSAFGYLRDQLDSDIASAHLVLSGSSAVLVRDGEELVDVVNRFKGQGVLNLLALSEVQSEVATAVHRIDQSDDSAKPVPGAAQVTHRIAR
ncbi:MAG: MerR family transcriptional regulator [Actinobacteria bacterium]|nr:MerR family transcriptional regulator [Actinomycetota bacterium]